MRFALSTSCWPTRTVFACALVPLCLATACVTVTPSQRKHLSKPEMTPATDSAEERFHTHVEASREGSFGGHGGAGGGCGCG